MTPPYQRGTVACFCMLDPVAVRPGDMFIAACCTLTYRPSLGTSDGAWHLTCCLPADGMLCASVGHKATRFPAQRAMLASGGSPRLIASRAPV